MNCHGLIGYYGRNFSGQLEEAQHNQYKLEMKKYWLKNHVLLTEFEKLAASAKHHGIQVVALKGVALINMVYQSSAERPMSDIDILISSENFPHLEELLISLEYSKVEDEKWEANNFKAVFSKGLTINPHRGSVFEPNSE